MRRPAVDEKRSGLPSLGKSGVLFGREHQQTTRLFSRLTFAGIKTLPAADPNASSRPNEPNSMRAFCFVLLSACFVCGVWSADDAFEADDEILKSGAKTNIEQFISTEKLTKKDENNDDLVFSTLLYTPKDTEKPEEFYSKVAQNLKRHAPKVRTINLFGGHIFYPENSTVDAIRDEVVYTKQHIKSLLAALNKEKIKVTSNVLTLLLVTDDKTQKESKIEKFVGEQFGKDVVVDDSNEDGLELLFQLEETDVHLYLVFINNLEAVKKTKLPHGRTSYARGINEYLEPVYDKLEEQSKKRIHKDESKLFVPGVKRLNKAGELHLEEFNEEKFANPLIKDTSPSDKLKQLVLSLGFPDLKDKKPEEFYKTAVEKLKKKAPKLKRVRLDGGFAYNPEKPQAEDIKNEINFLKTNVEAILDAFKAADVNVTSLRLKVFWLSTKKDAEDSGYPKLIKEAFGYEPNERDIDSGRVLMAFKRGDTDADVELNFYDKAPKDLPKGRTSYYSAAKLHEDEKDESESESNSKEE
ncbi:hypothetical protein M3Y99_00469000 [Aphelenchoides fujianensis]|nr:hypothetical protein M3Y99_00469000 [Aphelenchoides fujianensis]